MAEKIKKITIGSESREIEAATLGSEDKGNFNTPIYLEKGVVKVGKLYAGGTCVDLNGQDFAERNISIYAPTEAGTGSDIVMWDDDKTKPVWVDPSEITVGKATADGDGNNIKSTYLTSCGAISTYLSKTDAASTYLTQTGAAITYLPISSAANTYLTKTSASDTYLAITEASKTYATVSGVAASYLGKNEAKGIYLTTSGASSTYLTQTGAANTYLTSTGASSTYLSKTSASSTYIAKSSGINVKKEIYYADLVDVYIENVSHAKVTITAGASKDTQSGDVEVDFGDGMQVVLLSPQMISPGATFELFFDKNTDVCEVVCRDCYGECEKIIGTNTGDCSLGFDYTCDERDVYAMVELEWF